MALRKTLEKIAIDHINIADVTNLIKFKTLEKIALKHSDHLYYCLNKKLDMPESDAIKLLENVFVDCTEDASEYPTFYNSEGWADNEYLLKFIDYGYLVENYGETVSEFFSNIDDAIKFYKGE